MNDGIKNFEQISSFYLKFMPCFLHTKKIGRTEGNSQTKHKNCHIAEQSRQRFSPGLPCLFV